MSPSLYVSRLLAKLNALFGRGLVVSMGVLLLVGLLMSAIVVFFMNSAAPTHLSITSGPEGSTFQRNAEKYKKILAREGVTLNILPSEGSLDNLQKLSDADAGVDVGFVLGGEADSAGTADLVSLGSISYQPLMVFYRGKTRSLLSEFKGQRLYIGKAGSGAHKLALTLLKANGIEPGDGTTLVDSVPGDFLLALPEDRVDALFVMGDSTASEAMKRLLRTPDIHLFSFAQADGYTRRIAYLNKLELPMGSLDFGKNLPAEDVLLLGPTVELIARSSLHPALSDILLEAAREVHGTPGLFKKRGEFPSPLEHEFRISPDASRYYSSGKGFLYRNFPFWIASLIARIISLVVPVALVLLPAIKIIPAIYRWRMESRIYRWYRVLLELERDALEPPFDANRREELLRHLEHIERSVNKIVVPAAFGDLFYVLRGHIGFVRERLNVRHDSQAGEAS